MHSLQKYFLGFTRKPGRGRKLGPTASLTPSPTSYSVEACRLCMDSKWSQPRRGRRRGAGGALRWRRAARRRMGAGSPQVRSRGCPERSRPPTGWPAVLLERLRVGGWADSNDLHQCPCAGTLPAPRRTAVYFASPQRRRQRRRQQQQQQHEPQPGSSAAAQQQQHSSSSSSSSSMFSSTFSSQALGGGQRWWQRRSSRAGSRQRQRRRHRRASELPDAAARLVHIPCAGWHQVGSPWG